MENLILEAKHCSPQTFGISGCLRESGLNEWGIIKKWKFIWKRLKNIINLRLFIAFKWLNLLFLFIYRIKNIPHFISFSFLDHYIKHWLIIRLFPNVFLFHQSQSWAILKICIRFHHFCYFKLNYGLFDRTNNLILENIFWHSQKFLYLPLQRNFISFERLFTTLSASKKPTNLINFAFDWKNNENELKLCTCWYRINIWRENKIERVIWSVLIKEKRDWKLKINFISWMTKQFECKNNKKGKNNNGPNIMNKISR